MYNVFEISGPSYSGSKDYIACKTKLDNTYDKKLAGLKIRSKCNWHEKGEKSAKLFFNFGKNTSYSKSN